MKINPRIAICTVLCVAAGYYGQQYFLYGHRRPVAIEYYAGGGQSFAQYYRSDGSLVHIEQKMPPSGKLPAIWFIDFPRDLKRVNVVHDANIFYRVELPSVIARSELRSLSIFDWHGACEAEAKAMFPVGADRVCERRQEPFLGYAVWRTSVTLGENTRIEQLIAPALNWAYLKRDTFRGKEHVGAVVATRVVEGNPPESFFSVPSSAKETDRDGYKQARRAFYRFRRPE